MFYFSDDFYKLTDGFKKSKHIIEGEFTQGNQFHFAMEPIAARVVPIEDGYDVFCTSQWPNEVQATIAQVIDVQSNRLV